MIAAFRGAPDMDMDISIGTDIPILVLLVIGKNAIKIADKHNSVS